MKVLAIMIAMALLPSVPLSGQKSKPAANEQRSFCEGAVFEDSRIKPTVLPASALAKIMDTEQGRHAKEILSQSDVTERDPRRLLEGTEIHLFDSGGRFFFVRGTYPMSGADNTWFWIVREDGGEARILLFTGGNCLNLDRKKTLGYRDVIITWSSASYSVTTRYEYNGQKYRKVQQRTRQNR